MGATIGTGFGNLSNQMSSQPYGQNPRYSQYPGTNRYTGTPGFNPFQGAQVTAMNPEQFGAPNPVNNMSLDERRNAAVNSNMYGPSTDISQEGQAALRNQMEAPAIPHHEWVAQQNQTRNPFAFNAAMPTFSRPFMEPRQMYNQVPPPPRQSAFNPSFMARAMMGGGPSRFPYSTNYGSYMPTYSRPSAPMQTMYRPVPYMSMSQFEAQQAAAAPPAPSFDGGFKQGGAVDDGIASLLKK